VAAAKALIAVVAVYAGAGAIVAVCFVLFGVRRALGVEGRVTGGARMLLVPAAVALWPIVLRRWIAAARRR
jgi:hypothetical protein